MAARIASVLTSLLPLTVIDWITAVCALAIATASHNSAIVQILKFNLPPDPRDHS
jgi:hypothetical protein